MSLTSVEIFVFRPWWRGMEINWFVCRREKRRTVVGGSGLKEASFTW